MPTSRPRHSITETDEVKAALDRAAERWPEDRRRPARLLLHLVRAGDRSLTAEQPERARRRRDAVHRTAGAVTGAYPSGYLEELRRDWPE